jgi:hypothetical protein
MSTAQLGISVAKMIRAGKISAISCTGANLEEDIFNLVVSTALGHLVCAVVHVCALLHAAPQMASSSP